MKSEVPKAVRITGLSLINARPWTNGELPLAHFDCEVRGLQIRGCLLIRGNRNYRICTPKVEGPCGEANTIKIIDPDLRTEMTDAAMSMYRQFGGDA